MRKTVAFLLLIFLGGASHLGAQSLRNTVWKFYVQALNDTLTMHIDADTTWSTSSSGEMIIRSLWKESKDTLRLNDIDGMYPCHDGEGVYRFVIDGDSMSWVLLSDPCTDRAGALNSMKFIRKK